VYAYNVVADSKRLQTSNIYLWIVLIVPLFFLPNAKDVFNFPKAVVFFALVCGAFVHYILSPKQKLKDLSVQHRIALTSLLGASLFITGSAFLTDTSTTRALFGYPNRSNGLLTYLALFLFVWIVARMEIREEFEKKLERTLLFLITVFSVYSLVQLLDLDPINWNNPYNRIIGTLGNPNFSGAFLGVFGAVLVQLFSYSHGRIRFLYLSLSALTLFLGISTESFQAIMIFAIGISIQALVYVKNSFGNKVFSFVLGAFLLSSVLAFFSFLGLGMLGDRLRQATLILRVEYWRVGLEIAESFPLFGIGPDSYTEGWRLYRSPDFVRTYSEAVSVDSAHNVLINFMANFGIPAFIFLSILYVLATVSAIKVLFTRVEKGRVERALALLWTLLFIQSLFSLEQIGLNVLQWSAGSLLLNAGFLQISRTQKSSKGTSRTSHSPQKGFSARGEFSVISIIFCFVALLPLLNQEIKLNRLGATAIDKSANQDLINQTLAGFGNYSKGDMGRAIVISDFLLRAERYSDAQALVERVLENEPRDFQALEQLARLARFRSELNIEIDYRKRIEDIDPQNYNNLIALSEAYQGVGNSATAKVYAKKTLGLSNDLKVNELANSILSKRE
jgi:hypothetical protein